MPYYFLIPKYLIIIKLYKTTNKIYNFIIIKYLGVKNVKKGIF